jgi:hypothetical protein
MSTRYKRVTKKTGKNSRQTTTYNSNGRTTISSSNKPSAFSPRRTISKKIGKPGVRITTTFKQGGGWTLRSTETLNGARSIRRHFPKPRKLSKADNAGSGIILLLFFVVYLIFSYFAWFLVCVTWCTVFYTIYYVFKKYGERVIMEHESRIWWEPYINE